MKCPVCLSNGIETRTTRAAKPERAERLVFTCSNGHASEAHPGGSIRAWHMDGTSWSLIKGNPWWVTDPAIVAAVQEQTS